MIKPSVFEWSSVGYYEHCSQIFPDITDSMANSILTKYSSSSKKISIECFDKILNLSKLIAASFGSNTLEDGHFERACELITVLSCKE